MVVLFWCFWVLFGLFVVLFRFLGFFCFGGGGVRGFMFVFLGGFVGGFLVCVPICILLFFSCVFFCFLFYLFFFKCV